MSDDFVNVNWNEYVTYHGVIRREDAERALKEDGGIGILLGNAEGVCIVDGNGLENIHFYDDNGTIGKML